MRCVLFQVVLMVISSAAEPRWTPRSIERYRRARSGVWHGSGTLHNTLSGALIARVELTESVEPQKQAAPLDAEPGSASESYRSDRLLVYRQSNGTLLSRYGRRLVPQVRYSHAVTLSLSDEPSGKRSLRSLFLRASVPGGDDVASSWVSGAGPTRHGLSNAFELLTRPIAAKRSRGTTALPKLKSSPPSSTGLGSAATTPRVYQPAAVLGAARDEYLLVTPPLRPPWLVYRRTGRCPSWCGAGVCTLEVRLQKRRRMGSIIGALERLVGKVEPSAVECLGLLARAQPSEVVAVEAGYRSLAPKRNSETQF